LPHVVLDAERAPDAPVDEEDVRRVLVAIRHQQVEIGHGLEPELAEMNFVRGEEKRACEGLARLFHAG
jgi:hypothetical protein